MEKEPTHSFHVRLPTEVHESITADMRRKGGKSLNKEIVERLRDTTNKDHAGRIADALRPLLDALDEAERERFAALTIEAVELLAKGNTKRTRRRNLP